VHISNDIDIFSGFQKIEENSIISQHGTRVRILLYRGIGYFLRDASKESLHCSRDLSNENSLNGLTALPSCQETQNILGNCKGSPPQGTFDSFNRINEP
jgi:hypothetical protein